MISETTKRNTKRCNHLNGKEWLQNSVSIWSNIRKSSTESRFNHPASFPLALVKKILDCFTNDDDQNVLDPFVGCGTTVIQAVESGKTGIGFDISKEYLDLAESRLAQSSLFETNGSYQLYQQNALSIPEIMDKDSVDIVITSPPYWDILNMKRSADGKKIRNYGDNGEDLGNMGDYNLFMQSLCKVFMGLSSILKKDKYCIINVMDIRKGPKLFPIHSDLIVMLSNSDFELDDIIIWDRSHEYNNLRPLGYPAVFRINRIHEYLLIFKNRRSDHDTFLGKQEKNCKTGPNPKPEMV